MKWGWEMWNSNNDMAYEQKYIVIRPSSINSSHVILHNLIIIIVIYPIKCHRNLYESAKSQKSKEKIAKREMREQKRQRIGCLVPLCICIQYIVYTLCLCVCFLCVCVYKNCHLLLWFPLCAFYVVRVSPLMLFECV